MNSIKNIKRANVLKTIAGYGLLILSVLLLGFSLMSGAEDYESGLGGILKNIPNALPWVLLLVLLVIAWKKELIGGLLILIFGIGIVYMFNFSGPNFWWITFVFTLIIPILASFFIISWYLKNKTT